MKRIALAVILLVSVVQGATIRVPQDQATIQAGINAAVDGDTVLVGPGVYTENIIFNGKAIVLLSLEGRDQTIIQQATPEMPIVRFVNNEDTTSVIDGFTVRGAVSAHGILCDHSSPIVRNCDVSYCSFPEDGGGIRCVASGAKIRSNRIHHNSGGNTGGGIGAREASPQVLEISDNLIYDNQSPHGPGIGCPSVGNIRISRNVIWNNTGLHEWVGGIYLDMAFPYARIFNNTLVGNTKGILMLRVSDAEIRNNIVAFSATTGILSNGAILEYNCVWQNGTNNNAGSTGIVADPVFVDIEASDYRLSSSSPCINTGDPNPIYNDPDGSRNDIGAFPFVSPDTKREVPQEYPTIQAAIDAAVDGDTILISDGLYRERISCYTKTVTVGSFLLMDGDTAHVTNTIIDGDTAWLPLTDTLSVVRFTGGASIIIGVTIRGGVDDGVLAVNANPSVVDCKLFQNRVQVVESDINIRRTEIVGAGVTAPGNGAIRIAQSVISGELRGSATYIWVPYFYVDTSIIGRVNLLKQSELRARGTRITGPIESDISASIRLVQCTVDSTIFAGGESGVHLDSCVVSGLSCYNAVFGSLRNSLVRGPVSFIAEGMPPFVTISKCTIIDSIHISSGGGYLTLDSCNASLPSPIYFRNGWPHFSAYCSNIYVDNGQFWAVQPPTGSDFDTLNVYSLPPFFCDTAAGDYRIKDSSPCAPANNSCGVLIGAYGIGCKNIAPVLTSASSVQAVSGLGFVYTATSTDVDGPTTTFSFANYPSWLTAESDSIFGTPPLTEVDTSFVVIVSDGFLADTQLVTVEITESPIISELTTEGVAVAMNVISHTPIFGWQYFDATGSYPQTQFEIAVGSDSDWTHSELWNPAPFSGAATSKQYAGAALLDGQTYWVRARVRNALIWSHWKQTSFRMNSVPGVPQLRLPVDLAIVNTEHPTLVVRTPNDAENDSLLITFELSADNFVSSVFPIEVKASGDSLTSFWVNFPLNEDLQFWWRVKASDYYEESAYSPIRTFWINSVNTVPTAFGLLSPPTGSSPALPGTSPEFAWQNSLDFDPGDSVEFTLQLAIDPSFSFMSQIAGLTSPSYATATPLEWGRRYWWRVKAEDNSSGVRWSNETFDFRIMALGDADGSGTVSISDVVYLINFIFGGGPAPNPIESGDADCSGAVTISDVVYLINYIFAGTAAPCEG